MTVRTLAKEIECDNCGKKREFRKIEELPTWCTFQAARLTAGRDKYRHACSPQCALALFAKDIGLIPPQRT